uniref:Uncharacterized protein n=1 Tax=Oryza brachyantha TaxID=4533 RepID=J3MBN9_ORYBR
RGGAVPLVMEEADRSHPLVRHAPARHDDHGRRPTAGGRRAGGGVQRGAHEARVGDHGAPRPAHGPKPQDGLDGEAEQDLLGDVVRDVGHGGAGG